MLDKKLKYTANFYQEDIGKEFQIEPEIFLDNM